MSMEPDLYSLATLLRSTGRSAVEIARAYNATSPPRRISSQTVESWLRGPDATRLPGRPRWDVLAGLADALTIPRATLYAACAGDVVDPDDLHLARVLVTRSEAMGTGDADPDCQNCGGTGLGDAGWCKCRERVTAARTLVSRG